MLRDAGGVTHGPAYRRKRASRCHARVTLTSLGVGAAALDKERSEAQAHVLRQVIGTSSPVHPTSI
jgi:hypothetical protein